MRRDIHYRKIKLTKMAMNRVFDKVKLRPVKRKFKCVFWVSDHVNW